ncbi:MAG: hypothetical protein ABSH44_08830 [Bryobacteraceae bacterium]
MNITTVQKPKTDEKLTGILWIFEPRCVILFTAMLVGKGTRVAFRLTPLCRVLGVCLLLTAPCFANLIEISFSGTVTTGASPISNMGFVYYGTDGTNTFLKVMQIFTSCDASSMCSVSASAEEFLPGGWSPSLDSVYSIVGFHDGGPGPGDVSGPFFDWTVNQNPLVFIVANNSASLAGTDFNADFGSVTELGVASDIYDAFLHLHYSNVLSLLQNNTGTFPSATFSGGSYSVVGTVGTIYDFTGGTPNGSANIQVTYQDLSAPTPEPSTAGLLAGALVLLVAAGHKRLASRA